MNSGDFSPQVIKRGDEYVIHNMDPSQFTRTQRVALAMLVWDQVRVLMEANGQYLARDRTKIGSFGIGTTRDVDRVVARMVDTRLSSINVIRPRLLGRPDVIEKLFTGEIDNLHDAQRALGMRIRAKLTEGAESQADPRHNTLYGKGDRFDEAMEPLLRYLAAWKKRGFKYQHVPPRAAQKRMAVVDSVVVDLQQVRADLGTRSHMATLKAPAEKQRKEKS